MIETGWRMLPGALSRRTSRALAGVALYAGTLWAILTINFVLPRAMPGNPIDQLVSADSAQYVVDSAIRTKLMAFYGLDQPLPVQYIRYVGGVLRGDLGWSIGQNAPVWQVIWNRLPWTLLLVLPSLLIASLIALVAGTESGWARGSPVDRTLLVIFALLRTMPVFFVGVLAILLFSVRLGWFPLSGSRTMFADYGPWQALLDILRHWVLPATVLTLELVGGGYLLMRNSMVTVLGEQYMLVARAKGLSTRSRKYRHAMRNAMLPFFTLFSAQVGLAVIGAFFIETLFAYPGMGRLMFDSVGTRDYPVLQGVFLLVAVSVLTANLCTDLLYGRIDPRARLR